MTTLRRIDIFLEFEDEPSDIFLDAGGVDTAVDDLMMDLAKRLNLWVDDLHDDGTAAAYAMRHERNASGYASRPLTSRAGS